MKKCSLEVVVLFVSQLWPLEGQVDEQLGVGGLLNSAELELVLKLLLERRDGGSKIGWYSISPEIRRETFKSFL